MSCTYDPGHLFSVLSVQERQVQSQRYESIALVHPPEIWGFMNLRNGAVHGYSRDDPMSSQQLDDWFRLFSTLQAVEESYKESTYTIPFLRSEAVSQNPTTCPSQKRCKDHELIVSAHHEYVLKPRISKQKQIFTWLKNVLLKPFHELFSLSCALKEIWCRKKHETKLLKPKNHFDFVHDERFSESALSHCSPNNFIA